MQKGSKMSMTKKFDAVRLSQAEQNLDDFLPWIELQLYLNARDGATISLGVLTVVYRKLFGEEPDLKECERKHGEHKDDYAERYCINCDADTPHLCKEYAHERDSSNDWRKCQVCGKETLGS
jgi:hypothetical protein